MKYRHRTLLAAALIVAASTLTPAQQSQPQQAPTQQQTQQQPCSDSSAKEAEAVKKHVHFHLPAKLHQAIVNGTVRVKSTTGIDVDPNAVSTVPAPKQKQNPCDATPAPPATNH